MKSSLLAITALFMLLLTTSCSKDKEEKVYIKFENKSQDVLRNVRLTYYSGADQQSQHNINLNTLSPAQSTNYIGFESMTCFDGMTPFVVLEATNNGKTVHCIIRCATNNSTSLDYGYYTAEVHHVPDGEGFLFLQLER